MSSMAFLDGELRELLGGLGTTIMTGPSGGSSNLPYKEPNLPRDGAVCAIFAFILFCFNWGFRLGVVEPWVFRNLGGPKFGHAKLAKFGQSVLEAIFYGAFAIVGFRVAASQEWFWPSERWWMGYSTGEHLALRSDLRCFYILYCARYMQAAVSVLMEHRRKDFVEMMAHHILTVVIMLISYVYGWNRVGLFVMVLLDPADVPLHLAKLCKYTGEATKRSAWQFAADRLFEVFAVVFLLTRLGGFGYVCWSSQIETIPFITKGIPEYCVLTVLYLLLALQVYWFYLIVQVAVKLLRGKAVEDPRSDDESQGEKPLNKAHRKNCDTGVPCTTLQANSLPKKK